MTNSYYGIALIDDKEFATYMNDTGVDLKLTSIDIKLGVGNGEFTAGDIVTGTGSSIKLQLSYNNITAS
jgi:hypothetical protein